MAKKSFENRIPVSDGLAAKKETNLGIAKKGMDGAEPKANAHKTQGRPRLISLLFIILAAVFVGGIYYWNYLQSSIYIEKAEIRAPLISIGPQVPGVLERLYVHEGDIVFRDQSLAKVGGETMRARTDGKIISVMDVPGQTAGPQDPIVTMIDPTKLRLVGRVQEDKGLKDISPGQKVIFTVDAYSNKQYEATVERVALSARQLDIVFSISDKRAEREFEVTAIFNPYAYPEIRNGMSAKMWVYK